MNQVSKETVGQRLNELKKSLSRGDVDFLLANNPAQKEVWEAQIFDLETVFNHPQETSIALIGSTGAGKSTLLNALLGVQILPVSSMKPCTAVVTTVRYSQHTPYRAKISFLTQEEWNKELYASVELLDTELGEEERRDMTDWNALKRATRDKILAVYGKSTSEDEMLSLQDLKLPEHLAECMSIEAEPIVIESQEPKQFSKQLKDYLSGESSYWPVVKTVEVTGPFQGLKNGAVLIDLPGVNDPNQAREEVTKSFLREASYVFVVFSNRGITKDVRELLLEQKMLRQFLLEGRINTLTLISTHADNISSVDPSEFDLDQDAEEIEIIRARNKAVKKQTKQDLQDIADDLAEIAGAGGYSTRRLKSALEETQIFTVSSQEYMRMQRIKGGKKSGIIEDIYETEFPQLLVHIDSICRERGSLEEINKRVSLLISEIENFFRALRTQQEDQQTDLKSHHRELQRTLKEPRTTLANELQRARDRAESSFQAHQEIFEERLHFAIDDAKTTVGQILNGWMGIHWATLRAIVIREGEFVSPSTGKRFNFSEDIAEPILKAIPFVWDDFFGHHFETSLAELKGQLEGRSEVFLERLRSEARRTNAFDDGVLNGLAGDIEMTRQSLDLQIKEALNGLRRTITRKRVELANSITRNIGAKMKPAYQAARQEKGSGLKNRMLNVLRQHANQGVREMYEMIQNDLVEGITELRVQFSHELKKVNGYVEQHADRVLSNLGGGVIAIQTESKDVLLKQIDEVAVRFGALQIEMMSAA